MTTKTADIDASLMESWPDQSGLAVVIGAGGMSTVIARRLAQRCRLLIADINADRLATQVEKLSEEGLQVEGFVCDVTDKASVAALAAHVDQMGGFCQLAHVAGLSPSLADWRTIILVNLLGPALVTEALLPLARPGAAAVLISSLSAHLMPPDPAVMSVLDNPHSASLLDDLQGAVGQEMTSQLAYMYSKMALIQLARKLSLSWGKKGARIVSLSPGLIASPQGATEFKGSASKYGLLQACPLARQGNMQEIADAAEFLLSDRAAYINGIDLLVDGGVGAAVAQAE